MTTADVLVLRALGIGDLLVAVPALKGLRRAFPDRRTVLAAPGWLTGLAALTGAVDTVLPTDGLGALRWTGPGPSVAVNLHGRGPASVADLLATGPGRLLTHAHDDYPDTAGPPWREQTHEAVRWCRLLEWYGIAADPGDLALTWPPAPDGGPGPGAVVVHPGASVVTRRWPADRFAAVARRLAGAGHRVVVTGSGTERDLAAAVVERAGLGAGAVLAGRLGLRELAALVAGAELVVCGDTGVGHLATAYGTPSVLLFGPTPPARWGPPPGRDRHAVLWAGQEGEAVTGSVHPGLLELSVPDVLAAAGRVLGAATPRL